MARFTFGAHETENVQPVEFTQVIEVVKGRSIISLGDGGPNRFELGLSGKVVLRILASTEGIEVNCASTQNSDEPFASAVTLGEMPEAVPVRVIETKLRGFRTAFCIFYLLGSQRQGELVEYLLQHPFGDVEALLTDDEALQIESVSYGSWVATVRTKSREALRALSIVAMVAFQRTREALVRKLEAEARLIEAEADVKEGEVRKGEVELKRGELALRKETLDLLKQESEYLLDMARKIGDPTAKAIVNRRLREAIYDLASGDKDEYGIRSAAKRTFPVIHSDAWDYRIGRDGTFVTVLSKRATQRSSGGGPKPKIGHSTVFRSRRDLAEFVRAGEAQGFTFAGKEHIEDVL